MKAKLIAANVPASDHKKMSAFYEALFGIDLARSLTEEVKSSHAPIGNDGQQVWISDRTAEDEQIACVFAVENLEAAKDELTRAGGKVFVDNIETPISPKLYEFYRKNAEVANAGRADVEVTPTLGTAALIRDPENNVFAIMQLEAHVAAYFDADRLGVPLNPHILSVHNMVRDAGKALD